MSTSSNSRSKESESFNSANSRSGPDEKRPPQSLFSAKKTSRFLLRSSLDSRVVPGLGGGDLQSGNLGLQPSAPPLAVLSSRRIVTEGVLIVHAIGNNAADPGEVFGFTDDESLSPRRARQLIEDFSRYHPFF